MNEIFFKNFLSEQQNPTQVRQAIEKVSHILTTNEQIHYIAVQKPIVNISPECVVLTNKRFIIYKPTLLGGANFQDHSWSNLYDAHLSEGIINATLTFKTYSGQLLAIKDLPKAQARKLYTFAQNMEERIKQYHYQKNLESKRAASGNIYFQTPDPSTVPTSNNNYSTKHVYDEKENLVQKLKQLKEMLDAELITPQEYESKKIEILSKM